jgi:diazepam-binding inhibitor (GABA receptor modulating acyl-CoA-binding protein)
VWLRFHRSRVGLFVAVFVFRRLLRRADVKEVVRNLKKNREDFSSQNMVLKDDFDQAAKDALTLRPSTTNDDKLILYGLFKSATVGKPETSRPGIFDPKGRAKWDAWKKVEDKSKDEAMQDYILKVTQLKEA